MMNEGKYEQAKEVLSESFGHKEFRLNQSHIIKSILSKKDTLAIMPTGGGKSICYQIPALILEGVCLIISPLISLMEDQVKNLASSGIDACYLNSSLDSIEKEKMMKKIRDGGSKLLYISPEGIFSHSLREFLSHLNISFIAIDEAHCVSQWGHEFRNDYRRLSELKEMFSNPPVLALTATADSRTRSDICKQLQMIDAQSFISSFDRPNIKYIIEERRDEIKQVNDFINNHHKQETGIIYCLSRKKVERVANELNKMGYHSFAYHAGMSSEDRSRVQSYFNTDEGVIIVATIAFGMGIDRPDVRFVIHLDLPKSIEGYYQETGRAGRDGSISSAYMLYGLQDIIKLSQMLELTQAGEEYKRVARKKLDAVLNLSETLECRRKVLLDYFEEKVSDCGNCDTCLNPAKQIDALTDAQKMLSCIYRTNQMFGSSYVIDVLRGSKNARLLQNQHDKLSVYGIGKDKQKTYWNRIIRHLLNREYLRIKDWEYRSLALTKKSNEILKGEASFFIREQKISNQIIKKSRSSGFQLDESKQDLFNELKALRLKIAKEKEVPPYFIFGDKSLIDMCHLMPRNKDDFLMVNGVGQTKCDAYYKDFTRIITQFL